MDDKELSEREEMFCRNLIECMLEVEVSFSGFLSEGEGRFLLDQVLRMYLQPDEAVSALKEKFPSVVSGLLNYFAGTWMAFLLWDDFNKRFHVLHNYASSHGDVNISHATYEFVSNFVGSKSFKEYGFSEPMTDILFSRKAGRKDTLIFAWEGLEKAPVEIEGLPEPVRPFVVSFGLGAEKWSAAIGTIRANVEASCRDLKERAASSDIESTRAGHYEGLAKEISALAERIVTEEEGNPEIMTSIKKGLEAIEGKFGLSNPGAMGVVDPRALCRTLIWNRLFDSEWNYLYYIPARFLEGSAVSGIICALKKPLGRQEYVALTQIVNRIFSLFHFGFYLQQVHLFALRSATTAIMARNKSHIHGSHIEHGLRNKMDTFERAVEERLLSDSPLYKMIREKLTLADASAEGEVLGEGIRVLEELGSQLANAKSDDEKLALLRRRMPDLAALEEIREGLGSGSAR